jgi:serine/threonine protein kinase
MPKAVPPEEFPPPILHPAKRNRVLLVDDNEDNTPHEISFFLMRDEEHPLQVYQKLPHKTIPLLGKGEIVYAQVYRQLYDITDQKHGRHHKHVYERSQDIVIIKKLRRWVVDMEQERNGPENPYREISAMQLVGDEQHVVGIVEALRDFQYLYIVQKWHGHDLLTNVVHGGLKDDEKKRVVMQTLVGNLLHLKRHGVIHRDLSPENIIMSEVNGPSQCPLIDLAMAVRVQYQEGKGYAMVAPQDPCGKLSYVAPEVMLGNAFDFGIDVWSLGGVFFVLLTGKLLYDQIGDSSYRLFIEYGGLWNDAVLDDHELDDLELEAQYHLQNVDERIETVKALDRRMRQILKEMFQIDASERIKAEDLAKEQTWFKKALGRP